MIKILVIGQTPPPYGGQAMMIQRLVNAEFESVKIYHLRMSFSKDFTQVGNGGIGKLFHLIYLIGMGIKFKFKYGIKTLYYPPAGPNINPMVRDIVLLAFLRPFFSKTIFHFRAAGLSEFVERLQFPIKNLAGLIYRNPSGAIQLSSLNPPDGKYFKCKKLYVVPNGLEDNFREVTKSKNSPVQILSVGVLREDKGVLVLLEAIKELNESKVGNFKVVFMGEFNSSEFEDRIRSFVRSSKLEENVEFIGVKSGAEKWNVFGSSDILCFPTFFDSESFGNVVLEAMMFKIPVIASQWRGIPDVVKDGYNGVLVPIKNHKILAEKLKFLIMSEEERERLGNNGRKMFLEKYTLKQHLNTMENVLLEVASA